MSKIAGIDLGTTNSCVAVTNSSMSPKVLIPDCESQQIFPSCVRYLSKDEVVVGTEAYLARKEYSNQVAYSMKRHMEDSAYLKHIICENGDELDVSSVEVAAKVLEPLIQTAKNYYESDSLDRLVITTPAYFTETARNNTLKAAELAGMPKDKINLISEPTAAAVTYGYYKADEKSDRRIIVFDLGGGTFDITVLKITFDGNLPHYEVEYSEGNPRLGGDDADLLIRDELEYSLLEDLERMYYRHTKKRIRIKNEDVCFTEAQLGKLLWIAEQVKKRIDPLEFTPTFETNETFLSEEITELFKGIGVDLANGSFILNLPDEVIDQCIESALITNAMPLFKSIFSKCSDIKNCILIGGSTKASIIGEAISKRYPELEVKSYVHPDLAVAEGAAIYAELLEENKGNTLKDILSIPIGIEVKDNNGISFIQKMVDKNSYLPVKSKPITVLPSMEDGEAILVPVYQGVGKTPKECTLLGYIKVDEFPEGEREKIIINCYLKVTINGVLSIHLTVKNKETSEEIVREKELVRVSSSNQGSAAITVKDKLRLRWENFIESKFTGKEREENLAKLRSLFESGDTADAKKFVMQLEKTLADSEKNTEGTDFFD